MSGWAGLGRRAGLAGVAIGALAAGAAAGLAAERGLVRRRRFPADGDPGAAEQLGAVLGRVRTVTADDGAELFVEVVGDDDAPVTVVFLHGYALNSQCWHFQRRDLGSSGRLVFYDQRSHGRSGRGPQRARSAQAIDTLAEDLRRILEVVVPTGPVVLVGHSMGGMTVMALADRHPELFGERVFGVALISTSSGKLADALLGVPAIGARALHKVAPRVLESLARRGELVDRGRRLGSDVGYLMTRRYSFASDVSPALVEFTSQMIDETPIDVIADFFPAFATHDKLDALDVLNRVQTLILVGEQDLMTPADHSRSMLEAVPGAELVVVDNAGHMVLLEHPHEVNEHLRELVARAVRDARATTAHRGPAQHRGHGSTA